MNVDKLVCLLLEFDGRFSSKLLSRKNLQFMSKQGVQSRQEARIILNASRAVHGSREERTCLRDLSSDEALCACMFLP